MSIATILCNAVFSANTIGIIVNKDLYPSIKEALDIYISDCKTIEKKNIWLNTTFTATSDKIVLKDSLKAHYASDNLEGAIFFGDLPICRYTNVNDFSGSATFPCDLFYMDMNGAWTPETAPTSHSGDKKPEIWVSRLTASVLTKNANKTEPQIVNAYLARVAKRMCGQDNQPRNYVIAGMAWEWPGLQGENIGDLDYETSAITTYKSSADNATSNNACGDGWEKEIVAGREYGYVYSHSGPTSHSIGFSITDIYSKQTNCRFYNCYACSNGKYDAANMVGAYATDDNGLIAIGSSKTGSMLGYKSYNQALGKTRTSFGEAFKIWFTTQGLSDIKWYYGMNLQGVGTLHLQPYGTTAINPDPVKTVRQGSLNVTGSSLTFTIPQHAQVTLTLYSLNGALIMTLLNGNVNAGFHRFELSKLSLAKGIYLCDLSINSAKESKTIIVK